MYQKQKHQTWKYPWSLENKSTSLLCLFGAIFTSKNVGYQNCSDLLWEKIVLVIEKNFWNSRLKAENLQNFWDHLNNLFKLWNVKTIFDNRMLF